LTPTDIRLSSRCASLPGDGIHTMSRLIRLTNILLQLQSKRIVTSKEVADKFGISQRTVYRDIKALEHAGVPVVGEAGTGYWLKDDYRIPPTMFTEQEVNALLTAQQYFKRNSDQSLLVSIGDLVTKIKAMLKYSVKEKTEKLEQRLLIMPGHQTVKTNQISSIQSAIANSQIVSLKYHAIYSDAISTREVEPLAVCYTRDKWLMIGYCRMRQALREFRVDRMIHLTVTDKIFPERHFSFEEYVKQIIEKNSQHTDTPLS
jgi:predicted DNA-binding transcriptional regulator YafY